MYSFMEKKFFLNFTYCSTHAKTPSLIEYYRNEEYICHLSYKIKYSFVTFFLILVDQ